MARTELLSRPLEVLMEEAAEARDQQWGRVITYSPKVFVPLTRLCRDACGYCTFVRNPSHVPEPFMDIASVLEVARRGEAAGCTEALFTLGEVPELRYPVARQWLLARGHASTVDYLVECCKQVMEQTTLLPHANAGAITAAELRALRDVTASQGMMLESTNSNLDAHRRAPDKVPSRRMFTLESAGLERVPFTTGILVGIGESAEDRVTALEAIARSHRRHGHVSEVIVQNFRPKALTAMRNMPEAPPDAHLQAIALARLILPPEVHVQSPPNLTEDFGRLIDAGLDDWGGVSPVTLDHVNPERPWPALERLSEATSARAFELKARLPVHQGHAGPRWLKPELLKAVTARQRPAVGG